MNGPGVLAGPVIAQVSNLGWQVAGVGDLDGDGNADLIWHHGTTVLVVAWLMDGTTVRSVGAVATVADLNWQVQ